MKNPTVGFLFSFVLGLGVAAMFRPMCKGPECVVMRGPAVQDIRDAVYQFGSKCVEFKTKTVECPAKGAVDTVSFADYA